MKLGELGEFGLIERISSRVNTAEGVITGIGDDAAVTAMTPGMQLVTSTDMLLEDVHFRRCWHDPYRLGRKSLAVSISDIAAMGAMPRWALLSLAMPAGLPLEFLDEFTRGFLNMADEHGVSLIGGDTCSSKAGLVISVTVMGEQLPGLIVRRNGARPGDDIWVTGTLGDAALALSLLEGGADSASLPPGAADHQTVHNLPPSMDDSVRPGQQAAHSLEGDEGLGCLVSRLLDPCPRVAAGLALAESGLVSAMIDVSDGILADFGHMADLSHVGGVIHPDSLPVSSHFRNRAAHLPLFPTHMPLCGGEDYELAFTAAPSHREKISNLMKKSGIPVTPVGIVTSLPGVTARQSDGTPYILQKHGFNHFK